MHNHILEQLSSEVVELFLHKEVEIYNLSV